MNSLNAKDWILSNATLRGELTSLLKEALQGMKDDLTLPDEFNYSPLPDINIRLGVPKLPGQPGSNFRDYPRECHERVGGLGCSTSFRVRK